MNAVFQQTHAEPRDQDPAEPEGGRAPATYVLSLRRRFAMRLAQLHGLLTRRAGGSRLLSDKSALFALGERRLHEARRASRPLALAVFEFSDLKEVRAIYGSHVKRAVTAQVVARMAAAAGSRGVVARTAPTEFTLLLPGSDRHKARQAIRRAMGDPVRIEIESDDHEIVLVPEFQIECAGADIESIEELYLELCLGLKEAGRVRRERELYLTLERESYSRSGGAPLRPGDPDAHGPGADIPPTVPASLAPDEDNGGN
jgi:GGDEF domain-containing protein